jgi:hypothetical protein
MWDNEEKSRKSSSSFGWSTMIFTLISIILVIIFNSMDKGPPLPPFGQDFTSIDCHAVTFDRYTDRSGFLDFSFRVKPSVENPPEYLAHFITIKIQTPPTTMAYSGDHITNITRNSNEIGFSIVHTWAGPSTFTAQCLHNPPQTLTGQLKDIVNYVPEYSRSDTPGIDNAKFKDVCLEYEKFLYFVQVSGDRPAVPFDNEQLRFEMLKWPLEAYLKHKSVSMTHRTCYLVAPLEKSTWKMILLTMIPLAVSVARNSGEKDKPLFIFRKVIPDHAAENLKLLSPDLPVKLADIMCFDTLLMTTTYSRLHDRDDRIKRALDLDLRPLRQKLPASPTDPKTIVLCENLWDALEFRLKEAFPDRNIVKLASDDTMMQAIAKVRAAAVFIGDHISSLIHMLWLNEGALVIDLTPGEYSCFDWAEALAQKISMRYVGMLHGDCKCHDFMCYSRTPLPLSVVDYDAIFKEIEQSAVAPAQAKI